MARKGARWYHPVVWQLGPLKGQPKLCRRCVELNLRPEPVHQNSSRLPLCQRHFRERKNALTLPSKRNSPARLARAAKALGIPTDRHDTTLLSTCAVRPKQEGYFDHLPAAQREIAEAEFLRQLRSRPNYTSRQIGAMVARSIAYSMFGGKRGFDAHGRRMCSAKRYWRYMLAHHPECLPAGLDLSKIPQQPVPIYPVDAPGRSYYRPSKNTVR